ncbi:MAG: IS5 family transposase [Hassallia sp. WJT32-NPBG1]|nr:IS5 family transposase [Hassallia sp. WJT32-NPBG1]
MSRKPYPTDLTDKEWQILQPLIPPPKTGGRPRTVDMREILNAILYVQHSGCSWRQLPHDLPSWPTVYDYFRIWSLSGVWKRICQALRQRGKAKARLKEVKSTNILNSELVKTIKHGKQRISKREKKMKGSAKRLK